LLPTSYYVAPLGSDSVGDGSLNRPWASLGRATAAIPDDGSEVVFLDGTYGPQSISRSFNQHVTVRAQDPYRASWVSSATTHRALGVYGAANFTLSGFEIKGQPGGTDEYLIQITLATTHDVLLTNNIIHDGYNNDILKINDGAHHITVRGNVFYNQPPEAGDEHIDINTTHDVTIEDNVFFNDYAASGRPVVNGAQSFIVIKNSGTTPVSTNFTVRRNVFLNWQGRSDQPYLLLGEDGQAFYEAQNVLIENNLFLGNNANPMTAAFAVKGVKDVTFRANTVHGDFPLGSDSWGFAMRLGREGANPPNENICFYNNIWSDPTGTMTHFSSGSPTDSINAVLSNNAYYNGGQAIPFDLGRVLNASDDPAAVFGTPGLPADLSAAVPPVWNASSGLFADGSTTIEQARRRLVQQYGTPALAGSSVVDAADPLHMPADDILGRPRGPNPDIGAVEVQDTAPPTVTVATPNGGENWAVGSAQNITWSATDNTGVTAVDLYYSSDGGQSFTLIAAGEPNDGAYTWTVPNTPTSSALVKVVARDAAGNSGQDLSDAAFRISAPVATIAQDGFESGNYSGGTGWASPWTRSGDAYVSSTGAPYSGSYHARLRGSSGWLQRTVNLSGWSNVALRFWAKVSSFEGSDKAWVKVNDGSGWVTVYTFTRAHSDNLYHFYQISLPGMMTSNYRIAFDSQMSNTGDYWYVDAVELTGSGAGVVTASAASAPAGLPALSEGPVASETSQAVLFLDDPAGRAGGRSAGSSPAPAAVPYPLGRTAPALSPVPAPSRSAQVVDAVFTSPGPRPWEEIDPFAPDPLSVLLWGKD